MGNGEWKRRSRKCQPWLPTSLTWTMTDWWSSLLHLPFVAMNFFFFRNTMLLPFPKIRLRPGLRFFTLILISLSSLTMEEADHAASSSSSAAAIDRRASGDASSSSIFHVREEEDDRFQHIHEVQQSESEEGLLRISFRGTISAYEEASSLIRDDTWSCAVVVLTFCVSDPNLGGLWVYDYMAGPNTSILLQPNPIFVQYVKIEELNNLKAGLMLYGFYKAPPLDTSVTWSDTRNASVASDSHQEWAYFLNEGSQIDISYTVNSPSSSIFLVIADGNDGLAQWLENPTYPNTTLSWNVVHGNGNIQMAIYKASNYYVAVGNLNSEEVEVQLNFNVRAVLYNTTNAYYKCTFTSGTCGLSVMFPGGNSVLITSPDPEQAALNDGWDVKMSYGPRWATYVLGTGGMTILMLLAFNFVNKFQFTREDETRGQHAEAGSERAPLLSVKDDDLSSWGSSYDSASHDEEDFEQLLAGGLLDGKAVKDGEIANNTRRLCAICFDAPRDCFFLPCGHCVACFECGSRIAEAEGICPVCRRNMKKVRKIFTV